MTRFRSLRNVAAFLSTLIAGASLAGQVAAAECGVTASARPAALDCTIATIDACTLNDPVRAEQLLQALLGDGQDPAPLYMLGRYYNNAPPLFRDPVLAIWYLGRAADMGYEPAIAALAHPEPVPTRLDVAIAPAPEPVVRQPVNVPDPPSTLAGRELTLNEIMTAAYAGGFCTETQLLAAISIAIAESSLWTQARNWKPENGLRPATDVIGVPGPAEAWVDGRQLHSDRGLWQISSFTWAQVNDATADDPVAAAAVAYEMSAQGTDFTPWDSFARGNAQRHYDRDYDGFPPLRPIVQAFLAALP
jgi:hypothetical protein